MKKNKTLAIITPTYNRAKEVTRLYKSLMGQTCFDFNWYIIDDGSSDETEKVVSTFETNKFLIFYLKKENGGKHTAINEGLKHVEEPLTIIVDSDDVLDSNSIQIICFDCVKYLNESTVAGISYCKRNLLNNRVVGDSFKTEMFIGNYITTIVNKRIKGDKAEVFKTDVLKEFPFPVFDNESFLAESVVWLKIAKQYNFYYSNKSFYLCEYLKTGLTSQGKKKIFESPNGYALYSYLMTSKGIKNIIRLKYLLLFNICWKACGKKGPVFKYKFNVFGNVLHAILYLPSLFIYYNWRRKYV